MKTMAFVPQVDPSRWQTGECGTYAVMLLRHHPDWHLGSAGTLYPTGDYEENHYFAHDGLYAYDSYGKHKLPYLGVNRAYPWNHNELDTQTPEAYGLPDTEGDDTERRIGDAEVLARQLGQIP